MSVDLVNPEHSSGCRGDSRFPQEIPGMNDVEGVCAQGDLHPIEDVEKELVRDDWAIPSVIELNGTVNGSDTDISIHFTRYRCAYLPDKEKHGIDNKTDEHNSNILFHRWALAILFIESLRASTLGAGNLAYWPVE